MATARNPWTSRAAAVEALEALEAFRRSALLTGWCAPAKAGMGFCLSRLIYFEGSGFGKGRVDRYEEAVAVYCEALSLDPETDSTEGARNRLLRLAATRKDGSNGPPAAPTDSHSRIKDTK